MAGFLGSLFQSKAEREKSYKEYVKKVFPYGDAQKQKILDILIELLSEKDSSYFLMHYLLIKEALIDSEVKDYKSIAAKVEKKRLVKLTPELKECVRILIDKDLIIDESLVYPTVQELKEMAASTL